MHEQAPEKVEALRAVLRGDTLVPAGEGLEIVRYVPHGHVMAALATIRRIGLDKLLLAAAKRKRDLALALIVARLIDLESKFATARAQAASVAQRHQQDLKAIQDRVRRARNPLKGAAAIGEAVGTVLGKRKMAKHFRRTITDHDFSFERDHASIDAEARLDGIYVLRTSLPTDTLDAAGTVTAYKSLTRVERAFRSIKTTDIEVRPVFHWAEGRVRAHIFLCMLAYYLEWHMRQALAPILFDDHDRASAEAQRASPVAKTRVSEAARRKASTKLTDDGSPVHSFRSLLADLATLTRNQVRFGKEQATTMLATPTHLQSRAFALLGITPSTNL